MLFQFVLSKARWDDWWTEKFSFDSLVERRQSMSFRFTSMNRRIHNNTSNRKVALKSLKCFVALRNRNTSIGWNIKALNQCLYSNILMFHSDYASCILCTLFAQISWKYLSISMKDDLSVIMLCLSLKLVSQFCRESFISKHLKWMQCGQQTISDSRLLRHRNNVGLHVLQSPCAVWFR